MLSEIMLHQLYFSHAGLLASDGCIEDAIPFLCLYGFPIFSCLEQKVVLPTKEECARITTTTCKNEFNLAVAFGQGHLFPNCNELPSDTANLGRFVDLNY